MMEIVGLVYLITIIINVIICGASMYHAKTEKDQEQLSLLFWVGIFLAPLMTLLFIGFGIGALIKKGST